MNSIEKTLYLPLYSKAYVSQKGLILADPTAEAIWQKEGFPLKGKAKSKWLAYYLGIRAAVYDDWLQAHLEREKNAVVLHLGCGMDSRVLRIKGCNQPWFDVDLPEVIKERKRHFQPTQRYRMLPGDLRKSDWLASIPRGGTALILMEGVSMYLKEGELKALLSSLRAHFDRIFLLLDVYTPLAARLSRYRNPIRTVGVSAVYGVKSPDVLAQTGLAFVTAHEMAPSSYAAGLTPIEKRIFCRLYAGKFAQRLYCLWEFKGE